MIVKYRDMNFREFSNAIKHIKKLREIEDKFNVAIHAISKDTSYFSLGFIETEYVRLLEKAMNDRCNWISYFIYDCEFGEDPHEVVTVTGKSMELKTINQVYKLIKDEDSIQSIQSLR